MENCVEKIYCCDRDNNDNALAAAILANGGYRRDNDSPWAMAAMMNGGMNGMNAWASNPSHFNVPCLVQKWFWRLDFLIHLESVE